MTTPSDQLRRLRAWFVAYYAISFVLGSWASLLVVDAFRSSSLPFVDAIQDVSDGAVLAWSVGVGAAVFALGLFLFNQLINRKSWARAVILIIAWISGISALLSLISTCGTFSASGWLARAMPGADWGMIGILSGLANVASLAFAVYVVRSLQFNEVIRQEFEEPAQPHP